jgi:hypothetical protein
MAIKKKDNGRMNIHIRTIVCAVLALVILSTIAVGGIFAKYIAGTQTKGYLSSPTFYFTSDILKETAVSYTLNPGENGATEVSFQVRNFADELRIADKDISFSVDVMPSDGVTVMINGIVTSTGTLLASPSAGSSERITVSGLKNGQTYIITATGDAGFVSTLRASITVKPDEKEIYKHLDVSDPNYVLLTVWTKNLSGAVCINFPDGLIPDSTDHVMSTVYNYENGSYIASKFIDSTNFVKSYSSYVYRFFKTTNQDYTASNFTVRLGTTEAIEAMPE